MDTFPGHIRVHAPARAGSTSPKARAWLRHTRAHARLGSIPGVRFITMIRRCALHLGNGGRRLGSFPSSGMGTLAVITIANEPARAAGFVVRGTSHRNAAFK